VGEYTDPNTGVTTGTKYNFEVKNGERILYRFYNSASQAFFRIEFENHIMVIISKDGNPTKPYAVQRLDINAGERYNVIVHANQGSGTFNFLMSPIMRAPCTGFDGGVTGCQQFTHTLTYTTTGAAGRPITEFDVHFNPRKLKSTSELPEALKTLYPDATIVFDARLPERPITGAGNAGSFFDANGVPQFGFLSWELNKKQSIKLGPQYKAVPLGESHPNDNVYNFPKGTVLDVVFQTYPHFRGSVEQHPWHYHGHSWYVLGWGEGAFNYRENKDDLNFVDPHVADTTTVYGENNPTTGMNFLGPAVSVFPDYEDWNRGTRGWVLVRMVMDNPGTWIAHCHQEWHVAEGMYAFIGVGTAEDLEEVAPKSDAFSAISNFPECPASREGVAQLSESSSGVFPGKAITDGEKSSGRASGNQGSSSSEWGGSSANLRAANRGASFGYLGVGSSSNQAGFSEEGDSSNALPAAFNPSHSDSDNAAPPHSLGSGPSE
jgi:FtsP/CotA-like multicopper oxidase with cupredoxin domain